MTLPTEKAPLPEANYPMQWLNPLKKQIEKGKSRKDIVGAFMDMPETLRRAIELSMQILSKERISIAEAHEIIHRDFDSNLHSSSHPDLTEIPCRDQNIKKIGHLFYNSVQYLIERFSCPDHERSEIFRLKWCLEEKRSSHCIIRTFTDLSFWNQALLASSLATHLDPWTKQTLYFHPIEEMISWTRKILAQASPNGEELHYTKSPFRQAVLEVFSYYQPCILAPFLPEKSFSSSHLEIGKLHALQELIESRPERQQVLELYVELSPAMQHAIKRALELLSENSLKLHQTHNLIHATALEHTFIKFDLYRISKESRTIEKPKEPFHQAVKYLVNLFTPAHPNCEKLLVLQKLVSEEWPIPHIIRAFRNLSSWDQTFIADYVARESATKGETHYLFQSRHETAAWMLKLLSSKQLSMDDLTCKESFFRQAIEELVQYYTTS